MKITIEKDRLNAFKEYKEKIHCVLTNINELEQSIDRLKQKETIYTDLSAIEKEYGSINEIDWLALNIDNHTQFGSIESFSDKLDKMVIALEKIAEIKDSLADYSNIIHDSITYMESAYDVLDKYDLLVTDAQKLKALLDYRDDVKAICNDFEKFKDRSQRNPIKGKIQQFKKIYVYDFYIPAHEKYIGKKVNWNILNTYPNKDNFKKIRSLSQLTCINDTLLNQKILSWNELKEHQCINHHLEDNLKSSVRCQNCSFPGNVNYTDIAGALDKIDEEIEKIFTSYEKTVAKEIRSYRDNMKYLDKGKEKKLIKGILDTQQLPEHITTQMIQTINKLFKEIIVMEIDQDKVIEILFPGEEMTTMEELRKGFLALEDDIKGNKQESEIRIKLIKKNERN